MATWTPESKNVASWTEEPRSAVTVTFEAGASMGLLLALTWDTDTSTTGIAWTALNKN